METEAHLLIHDALREVGIKQIRVEAFLAIWQTARQG
jgi:hypothetical protein